MSNSSRSSTPAAGVPQVANYLRQAYTREVEAAQGGDPNREIYKAAGPAWVGSWGAPKTGLTADGKDFLAVLSAAHALKAKGAAVAAGGGGGKGPKKA